MCSKLIISVILLLIILKNGSCQPMPCDDRLFLLAAPAIGQPSGLEQISINPVTNRAAIANISNNTGAVLGAVGYSTQDGHLYGLDVNTYELYRIDGAGKGINLGVPENLDKNLEYYAGTINPIGKTFILIGRDKETGVDKKLISIGLFGNVIRAGFVSIICDWESSIGDIAHDPFLSTIVGYDNKTRRLINLGEGGLVTSVGYDGQPDITNIGSLFFDVKGNLYGYGGTERSQTVLYKFEKNNKGKGSVIGGGLNGRITDGCSCPYRITFEKSVAPRQVLPCAEVTYSYHFLNTAGTSFTGLKLIDTFPESFEIVSIKGIPSYSEVQSGIGSNILYVKLFDLYMGDNEVEIKVRVGSEAGQYPSQANVSAFPPMVGKVFLSDDLSDTQLQSPTVVTVVEDAGIISDNQFYLCPGGSRTLQADVGAANYLWNTGDTTATLNVTEPGIYAVIAQTDCGDFYDTVKVLQTQAFLFINLGEDQTIEQGDILNLNYNTNGKGLTFSWQATGDSILSCNSCSNPNAKPLIQTNYTVTVTDENGCIASDTLQVQVLPVREIFVPTAFSPNNDGINDIFYLQGKSNAKIIYLRIFDRWGNQVFQVQNGGLNDTAFGWNGRVATKLVSSQTFIYVAEIEFPDGAKKRLSGEVSLL